MSGDASVSEVAVKTAIQKRADYLVANLTCALRPRAPPPPPPPILFLSAYRETPSLVVSRLHSTL